MDLYAQLKNDKTEAMTNREDIKKNILRVVVGELDNLAAKQNVTNDDCIKVIKKCITNNEESIKIKQNELLVKENEILNYYLPKSLTQEEIKEKLQGMEIGSNVGKATGIAVKYLKEAGFYAEGKDVRLVVEQLLTGG